MILVIFTTQLGEAFAFSAMPCADDDVMMPMSKMIDHSNHIISETMNHAMNDGNSDESMDDESCCQKDCCCPMGIVSLAIIFEMHFKSSFHVKTTQPLNNESSIIDIFLNQPQRPPIFILS